jgi:hypothetical protein
MVKIDGSEIIFNQIFLLKRKQTLLIEGLKEIDSTPLAFQIKESGEGWILSINNELERLFIQIDPKQDTEGGFGLRYPTEIAGEDTPEGMVKILLVWNLVAVGQSEYEPMYQLHIQLYKETLPHADETHGQ